jgi:hypothetical protein
MFDLPSMQFQHAHARQKSSEKPAPLTLAWAIFGHVANLPFRFFTTESLRLNLPSPCLCDSVVFSRLIAASPGRFSENGKNGEKPSINGP